MQIILHMLLMHFIAKDTKTFLLYKPQKILRETIQIYFYGEIKHLIIIFFEIILEKYAIIPH